MTSQLSEGTKLPSCRRHACSCIYKAISTNYDYVENYDKTSTKFIFGNRCNSTYPNAKLMCVDLQETKYRTCPALSLNNQPMDIVESYKLLRCNLI